MTTDVPGHWARKKKRRFSRMEELKVIGKIECKELKVKRKCFLMNPSCCHVPIS